LPSKVFIPQIPLFRDRETGIKCPKFDVSPALNYGTLVELLESDVTPFQTEFVIDVLNEKLYNFSDDDYLLLTGNPGLIGITAAIAASYNEGRLKMLQWDARRGGYEVITAQLWSND